MSKFDERKIAELVRRRKSLGLTQHELEERLGLSPRMVNKWENKVRNPTASNLDRWAAALGLRIQLRKA